jgi:hypothetical protein
MDQEWSGEPIRPQEAFQRDVLCRVVAGFPGGIDENLGGTAAEVAARLDDAGGIDAVRAMPVPERWQVLREIIRVGAAANLRYVAQSREWRAYLGIAGAALSRREAGTGDDPIIEALIDGERRSNERYAAFYEALRVLFDLELRPGLTMALFAAAAASLVEGVAIRATFNPVVFGIRPDGDDGPEWDLFGLGFEALARRFFVMRGEEPPAI